ncbi:MAG: hypothetical protein LVQ96_01875 [Thermoplasmatales archaeon]|nr:hypothetical protein [Thermoplasmatales archaeon]MCW6169901.1 hypothetical protein [Thermoplasmatales archaeon]
MNSKFLTVGIVILVVGLIVLLFGFGVFTGSQSNLTGYSAGVAATPQINITSSSLIMVSGSGMYLVNNSAIGNIMDYSTAMSNVMHPNYLGGYSVGPGLYYVVYVTNNTSTPALPSGHSYKIVSQGFLLSILGIVLVVVGVILAALSGVMKKKGNETKAEEKKPEETKPVQPEETKSEQPEQKDSSPPDAESGKPQDNPKTTEKKNTSSSSKPPKSRKKTGSQ